MKKLLSLCLVGILVLTLAACGGGGSSVSTAAAEPATSASESEASGGVPSAEGDNSKKMAVLCNTGGLGDKSFNDSANVGLQKAAQELGLEYTIVEPTEVSQGETYMRQFADAGYGVVLTLEYPHAEIVDKLAGEYPNTTFVCTDQVVDNEKVMSIIFDYHQSSYLAGYAAGLIASGDYPIVEGVAERAQNTIGVICALESDGFHNFTEAFTQGAYTANPDITVLYDYSVGFTDTQNAKTVAENMINNQNADVVFQVCGLAGLGILQAARLNNAFAIGVDSDQDYIEPGYVLTSVLKRVDIAVYKVAEQLLDGSIKGGILALPLGDGTDITDMAEIAKHVTNQEKFDELKALVADQREQIINGDIVVVEGALGER